MDKIQERFSKLENVENLFCFYTTTIKWLCKNFFNEKLVMVFCAAKDGKWEAVDEESTEKICRYHELFLKFNAIMNNDFDEKKCEEILNLYEIRKETFIDVIEFLDFCSKDKRFLEK